MSTACEILLIEDDEEDSFLIREILGEARGQKFRVQWVRNYEMGRQALQAGGFDAVLLDYSLGGRTGLDLIREAAQWDCDAPIILLTGQGNYELDVKAMEAGVADYLAKSELAPSLLERTIRYALERKRTASTLRQAYDHLETRVRQRTDELALANEQLGAANRLLARANAELRSEIAERERIEEVAERERRRLFFLLEQLPVSVHLKAPDYTIRFANALFKDYYGEPDGQPCYTVLHKRSLPCDSCPALNVLQTRTPLEYETAREDGQNFQVFNYPFTDVDGSPLVLVLEIDITARKRAEAKLELNNQELIALTHSERNQRRLAESLAEAAIALSASLELNEVLDRILEQTQRVIPCSGAAIGLLDNEIIRSVRHRGHPDHGDAWRILEDGFSLNAVPVLETMKTTRQAVLIENTHSDPRWLSTRGFDWIGSYAAVPLLFEGEVVGFLNVLSDQPGYFGPETTKRLNTFAAHAVAAMQNARLYTELETALSQEQAVRTRLIRAEKLAGMGRMVATVAHELNNPLQTIKNCLFLAQQELEEGSPLREYLNMAVSESRRLSGLVTQLRELNRPPAPAASEVLDLVEILAEVRALLLPVLEGSRVTWWGPELRKCSVQGVRDQLKQVFLNIAVNAIEAMQPNGGDLWVDLVCPAEQAGTPDRVGVRFRDSGQGILPENLGKLFEPFFTTKVSGLGLGLSICYEIVERHSGSIQVETFPGKGAAFTVWLPTAL